MSSALRLLFVVSVSCSSALLGACNGGSSALRDAGSGGSGGSGADARDTVIETDAAGEIASPDSVSDGGIPTSNCGVANSLLVNCGFELPVVPLGSYQQFVVGQSFNGWMVVGPTGGDVAPLSGTFQQNGFSFPAHEGAQALDLTGFGSNTATGVSQAVTTTPGARYDLSFWVGNLVDTGIFGTTSTVLVFVDGNQILSAKNDDGARTNTLAWKGFTASFVAAAASTTIEFRNADPATDNSNILDDITLVPAN